MTIPYEALQTVGCEIILAILVLMVIAVLPEPRSKNKRKKPWDRS